MVGSLLGSLGLLGPSGVVGVSPSGVEVSGLCGLGSSVGCFFAGWELMKLCWHCGAWSMARMADLGDSSLIGSSSVEVLMD